MKRIRQAIYIIIFFGVLFILPDQQAKAAVPKENRAETALKEGTQAGQTIKEKLRNELKEMEGTKAGLLSKIREKVMFRASVMGGKITGKTESSLTVDKEGKIYTVNTDAKTQYRRKFWGKSSLSEMQVGDFVNVHGKWTDDAQTVIQATLIRDLSLQARFGVFFGTIESVSGDNLVIKTAGRGNQTVTLNAKTKIVDRANKALDKGELAIGHKVRVKGLWNNTANTITEVSQVKDFDLPVKPTGKATPGASLTPTVVASPTVVPTATLTP